MTQEAIYEVVQRPVPRLVKSTKKPKPIVVHDDPRLELRRLVSMHKRWTQTAKAWEQSTKDILFRETGEVIKCTLPEFVREDIRRCVKALNAEAKRLETAMTLQLRQLPIYKLFLSRVYGVGPVVAAYLCAMIRIERAVKPSQLNRYCGNACDPTTGKRELRSGAPKYMPDGTLGDGTGSFNDELKCRIWQGMTAGMKNAAKVTADRPHGTSTKYLVRWAHAVHSRASMGREKGAFHAGRRKATDLFLEDLYTIWRTLEGLPVWPDLYSVRRGYHHGGKPCVNEGRIMTLAEAFEMIGDFEDHPAAARLVFKAANEVVTEDEEA